MPAKTELKELLQGFGKETEVEQPLIESEEPIENKKASDNVPPSRRGKRHISGYFKPEVLRQVKVIAAEEDKNIQDVLGDALNALFVNKGKPPIA